jgi:ribosomal protein S18 acetylase RimI-like enzyme
MRTREGPGLINYRSDLTGVNWEELRGDLIADDFHNGRTTAQLRLSFENSACVAMAFDDTRCIGNGRMLSDGVGNAYAIDVWTQSDYRSQGIASKIMGLLLEQVPGQHIYLQTDDAVGFYKTLGFREEPTGLSMIAGDYLRNSSRDD